MIKPDRNDHAGMVEYQRRFNEAVGAGTYKRVSYPKPLTHDEAVRVSMVSTERRSFAVIPAECMEAWGRGNRW